MVSIMIDKKEKEYAKVFIRKLFNGEEEKIKLKETLLSVLCFIGRESFFTIRNVFSRRYFFHVLHIFSSKVIIDIFFFKPY